MYPATSSLLPIAQVLKSYGTEGEVVISFLPDMPDEIDLNEPIFFLFEGLSVPFFIESLRERGTNKAYLKLEDIDSIDQAEEIVGMKMLLPLLESSDDEVHALVGFSLLNQDGKSIGIIQDIQNFGGNICLEVDSDTLIPYHSELVIRQDNKKKTLKLQIAEGL